MATHSSILSWVISRTEEPGGLQSLGLQRVGHDRAWTHAHIYLYTNIYLYVSLCGCVCVFLYICTWCCLEQRSPKREWGWKWFLPSPFYFSNSLILCVYYFYKTKLKFGSRALIKHIYSSFLPPNISLKWQSEHFQVLLLAVTPTLRVMRIKICHIVLNGYYLHSLSTYTSKENTDTGILNPSCAIDPFEVWWSPWTSSLHIIF